MKKKYIMIIAIIVVIGLIFSVTLFNSPKPSLKKEEEKTLRKITEEEISHETATEIVEFHLEKKKISKKIDVKRAKILANNEKGEYLVRIESDKEEDNKKTAVMKYLGDGNWRVMVIPNGTKNIDEKYTEFWPEEAD